MTYEKKRNDYRFKNGALELLINKIWRKISVENIIFEDVVGEGANGIVLKGFQKPFDREVGIKFWLPNQKSKNGKVNLNQYLEEIKKITKLKDRRIIQMFTGSTISQQDNGIFYSVMDYIDGITLKKWLEEHKSSHYINEKVKIAKEILETMSKCHELGIYHGDLHSKNIMITKNNEISILDFGTSFFSKGSNENKAREREAFLLAETIFSIVGNYNIIEYCRFKMPKYISEKDYIENDVRIYDPKYIGKTLYHLINIVDLLELVNYHLDNQINDEISKEVVECHYIDLEKFLIMLANKKPSKEMFSGFLFVLDEYMEYNVFETKGNELEWISCKIYYDILLQKLNDTGRTDEVEHLLTLDSDISDTYIKVINWIIYNSNLPFEEVLDLILDIFKKGFHDCFVLMRFMMWIKLQEIYEKNGKIALFAKNDLLRMFVEIKDNNDEYSYWEDYVRELYNNIITSLDNEELYKDLQNIKFELLNNEDAYKKYLYLN